MMLRADLVRIPLKEHMIDQSSSESGWDQPEYCLVWVDIGLIRDDVWGVSDLHNMHIHILDF